MLCILSVEAGAATAAEIKINGQNFSMHMLKCFREYNSPFAVCILNILHVN
jgi:hypothetical protein